MKKILKLEATRFLYLNSEKIDKKRSNKQNINSNNKPFLLVICDYTDSYTEKQIKILSEIKGYLDKNFIIKLKPHLQKLKKFQLINKNKFPIIEESLSKISKSANIVLTSNTTTAALEFYILGKPVISILDDKALNLSPLRNMRGVYFISDSSQLINILKNYKYKKYIREEKKNLFYLNNELINWTYLLEKVIKYIKNLVKLID